MRQYFIEPRTIKHVKEYGLLSFARKYKKRLLDTRLDECYKNGTLQNI